MMRVYIVADCEDSIMPAYCPETPTVTLAIERVGVVGVVLSLLIILKLEIRYFVGCSDDAPGIVLLDVRERVDV
jgi:hypothetical protein